MKLFIYTQINKNIFRKISWVNCEKWDLIIHSSYLKVKINSISNQILKSLKGYIWIRINLSSHTYIVPNFKSILVFNYIFYVLFLCLILLLLPLYIIKIKGEYSILLDQDTYLMVICTVVTCYTCAYNCSIYIYIYRENMTYKYKMGDYRR